MKNVFLISMVFVALIFSTGCKKKKPLLEAEPTVKSDTVKVDSSFSETKPFENVDTSDNAVFTEAQLDEAFQKEVTENLKTIYFDYNSYSLSSKEIDQLQVAGEFLMKNKNIRILVEGHCDQRGSAEYNMGLGENRAKQVKDYLVNYGIDKIRIETTSYGKERPAVDGCMDESCYSKNRRVEFKVLEH